MVKLNGFAEKDENEGGFENGGGDDVKYGSCVVLKRCIVQSAMVGMGGVAGWKCARGKKIGQ